MVPQEIQNIFDFIEFLDANKKQYIETYLPICNELEKLDNERKSLRPNDNYKHKIQLDTIQRQIDREFEDVYNNVYIPVTAKLKELGIWSGDQSYISIKNNISSASTAFKNVFQLEDLAKINSYKDKYISFRKETNSNFLSLQLVFSDLDEALRELFDYFKDDNHNDFQPFEAIQIECKSIEEALQIYANNPRKNIQYTFPASSLDPDSELLNTIESQQILEELATLKSHISELLNSSNGKETHSSYEEAIYRVRILKSVIEDKGGFRLFKNLENQKEAIFQLLFQFVKEGAALDINAEVNNGRGPVDFIVSNGPEDKTVIEFKLAKNKSLRRNLRHQITAYKKANNTDKFVIAILYFNQDEYRRALRALKMENLFEAENVFLIDGQQKASASTIKE